MRLALLWLTVLTLPVSAQTRPVAITDVTVIDGASPSPRRNLTVVIDGGRIVALTPSSAARIPANALRLDGRGKYLIPGLWDMHVHLTKGGQSSATPPGSSASWSTASGATEPHSTHSWRNSGARHG